MIGERISISRIYGGFVYFLYYTYIKIKKEGNNISIDSNNDNDDNEK